MSKQTNVGTAILGAILKTSMTQEDLGNRMDVSQASISRLIGGKNRPTRETMHSLCNALKRTDYEQAVRVLIGFLEDEIEASGMLLSDIELAPANRTKPAHLDIEKSIDTIRAGALQCKEAASLVRDLAWMIKHANLGDGSSHDESENEETVGTQEGLLTVEELLDNQNVGKSPSKK